MNISFENKKVYRKDFDNGTRYSMQISKKDMQGNYQNTFIELKFKKDVVIDNETFIDGKGWLSFYFDKNNKPVYYAFINEYKILNNQNNYQVKTNDIPDEMKITDADLPF